MLTDYQNFIALSRYARWKESEGRRETWGETVDRLITFWEERFPEYTEYLRTVVEPAIFNLEVMPSMRTLMTAGEALKRDEVAGYNCAFAAIDEQRTLDEIFYVLMCGTGVGFSVEKDAVSKLPNIAEEFHESTSIIKVPDSKIGWATSFRELISLLYSGKIPKWDLSKIRPAGSRLKTFGGRASGPEPLNELFKFSVDLFSKRKGHKLLPIEVHDLVCKIADIVVVGGVRRSALISLSDLHDELLKRAKVGRWWTVRPERALANNSAVYLDKPDLNTFLNEWGNLYESKSGERGFFNRNAAKIIAARNGRRDSSMDFGTNPCSEIILRSKQFCNLTEAVVRPEDSLDILKTKVEIATFLGTLQSTLTNFRYLSRKWRENTEEERLLGVSLTGIMDHPVLSKKIHGFDDTWEEDIEERTVTYYQPKGLKEILTELRDHAITTNSKYANELGINVSAAISCVKPSGTVSQLVDSASGIHPRYSEHYIRTVRLDKKDPLYDFMRSEGFPVEDEKFHPNSTAVFSFPMKAPEGSVVVKDVSAIQQLDHWKLYAEHWCEHKPSVTVFVKEEEWLDVAAWVWRNFDILSGVSFLPFDDHVYEQAPYQEISAEKYKEMLELMPKNVNWNALYNFEKVDNTTTGHELACSAGNCEI